MSRIFQMLLTRKMNSVRKLLKSSISPACKCISKRKCSDVPKKFIRFNEVVAQRRAEARRSLVVQVNSESSFSELYNYCARYAVISGVHHYQNSVGEHFMLIEFESEENCKDVLHSCSAHQKDPDITPLQSPFLWFRAMPGKSQTSSHCTKSLTTLYGTKPIDEDELFTMLSKCETVSEQIQLMYDKTVLNDLSVRLRYLVARQLEMVFESLYANVALLPFGSSVNGFGKMGCDLDLVLTNILTEEMRSSSRRLVHQSKRCEGGRSPWQRHLELAGAALELRAAGATRVTRILHARVPILKFGHEYADLDCDLCHTTASGVQMSGLVWCAGSRSVCGAARPLVGAVRRWARAAGLTSAAPGRWLTNFPLTLMVLFFLQQRAELPPLVRLVRDAGKRDIRVAEDDVECTFLRDMSEVPADSCGQNSPDLGTLLFQFFEFYAQFDFQEKAISVNEGTAIRKPNTHPLYIVNPLESSLNVSRNVSFEECERLKMEVRNAAWQLEAELEGKRADDWGLLGLIERQSTRGVKKLLRVGNSHRLVSMKDLFSDSDTPESSKSKSEKLNTKVSDILNQKKEVTKQKEQKIKFKNSQIASEVYRIRRDKMV